MALTHQVIESRWYLNQHETEVIIVDEVGNKYHECFCLPAIPSQAQLDDLIAKAKERIQKQLDFAANDMNLPADEMRALEYLRDIKREIVMGIRSNPAVTLAQAKAYIEGKYPNSVINFDRLYQFYLSLLNLSTWDEFKQWIIDRKFEGID